MNYKVEFEIEIDDDLYEPTGEFRRAGRQESFCDTDGEVQVWLSDLETYSKFFILRKKFIVPAFVPPGWWLAVDENGDAFCYCEQPRFNRETGRWLSAGHLMLMQKSFLEDHNVTLPDVPAEQACWQQPRTIA